jgi:beta-1,4-mannosyltransferase
MNSNHPRKAFVSPFQNHTNRYIELQKDLLRESGFEVLPMSIKALLTGQAFGIFRSENLLAFHWLETRPFVWRGAQPSLAIKGMIEFVIYLAVIIVARARVVYFVHDHAVHDATGWHKTLSVQLIKLLRYLATDRVVHDPSYCDTYQARYLPHPLYWDADHRGGLVPATRSKDRPMTFGLLGAVRPYKCIHDILEVWPVDVPLLIRGRSTQEYEQQLREIICRRGLDRSVDFQAGFLSDEDFSASLDAIDVLILPHKTESMLVSGAFFEGAGRVPRIIARHGVFMRWAQEHVPGIDMFEHLSEIPDLVASMQQQEINTPLTSAQAAAVEHFGWAQCKRAYAQFYQIASQMPFGTTEQ